ncbi:hypothetical protein ABT56_19475 [Photobacterium aquae]|uniref:Uncharacterized protein n=1 Tax=Photobacterium aquae TaxID=1195763 RepID=A0A0J1JMF5_9GAMM|nr:hypothetical protein [Photobacterium aquae]KLV03312.1 hypothetical protein ABT56_19475 [Photobacterium aquae]
MDFKKKVRPNLTNYDVIEIVQYELQQAEKRLFRRTLALIFTAVISMMLFIVVFVSAQEHMVKDLAAGAMRKAFEAEKAIHIIDEAAGTNFLEQSQSVAD